MNKLSKSLNLNISHLLNGYKNSTLTPTAVTEAVIQQIPYDNTDKSNIWIHKIPHDQIHARAKHLESAFNNKDDLASFFNQYPLYGIPFAIKDNMDVKDLLTTCACPGYEYIADKTAKCVDAALSKGAILIGKTNMDQFATGLNGTRSPFGTPVNSINNKLIPGGSSSGSAVSVSSNLVSFSLGTDTAGSGRVPAAMNNIFGIKPSLNIISTEGIVPACKSLDCCSIFANNLYDSFIVLNSIKNEDQALYHTVNSDKKMKFGIPKNILNEKYINEYFCGDLKYFNCYKQAIDNMDGECVEIEFDAFFEVAQLLYDGPWVTERLCALPFMSDDAVCDKMDGLNETVRGIIGNAKTQTAKNCFDSFYKLESIKSRIQESIWNEFELDFLCIPTIPTSYTVDEVLKDPVTLNSNLGKYTNFVNLLDFCAIAMPVDMIQSDDGNIPFGVTLVGQNRNDLNLMLYANQIGGDNDILNEIYNNHATIYKLCVCGAHMSGGTLNYQLKERNAKLFKKVKAAPNTYEMYSIDNDVKPGLVKIENDKNVEIEMEIWSFKSAESYADFIAKCIKEPLCIGDVRLNDNTHCKGFLMQSFAINAGTNITEYGSWRNYKKSKL